MLLIWTIAPDRRERMWGSTARVSAAGPNTWTSNRSRSSASVVSSAAPTWVRPALFTSTSIRPCRPMTSRTVASTEPGSVTSSGSASTWPGCAAARLSSDGTCRAVATATSPAATAASVIARPKPLFAPVISQTLFIMSSLGLAALAVLLMRSTLPALPVARPRPDVITDGYGRARAGPALLRGRRRGSALHPRSRAALHLPAGAEQADQDAGTAAGRAAVRPPPRGRSADAGGGGAAAACPPDPGRVGPRLGGSRAGQEQAAGDPGGGNEHQPGAGRPAAGDQVPVRRPPSGGIRATAAGQLE